MIKFSEWKSVVTDPPKEDGDYLVLRFDNDGRCYSAGNISFLVGVGWNVHRFGDELSDKSRIIYKEDDTAIWAKVWEEKE